MTATRGLSVYFLTASSDASLCESSVLHNSSARASLWKYAPISRMSAFAPSMESFFASNDFMGMFKPFNCSTTCGGPMLLSWMIAVGWRESMPSALRAR